MYEDYCVVDFFDNGKLLKEIGQHEYKIITCNLVDDTDYKKYLLSVITIKLDVLGKSTDGDCKETAIECIDMVSPDTKIICSKNEIIDWIDQNIIDEISWDFYRRNFYHARIVVCEFKDDCGNYNIKSFDSMEEALRHFESVAKKGYTFKIIDM